MKKAIFTALIGLASVSITGCANNSESNVHTHEDGSTHADHDTIKPAQEEFMIRDTTHTDSAGREHTHKDGEKHSH
jgi:uncharacterized lipoprotein NlpE involved in copper resistance